MTTNGVLIKSALCGSSCSQTKWGWDVPLVTGTQARHLHKYAVMILNRPITQCQHFMKNFWNTASLRVTVDGGTLQWDLFLKTLSPEVQKTMRIPELVTGDFDSITEDIKQKYKNKGCKIVHTPDQDFTDFTKAIMELDKYCKEHQTEIEHVIAVGQTSGRLDQIIGNIQTLFLTKDKLLLSTNTRVYLMSDDSLSWLLVPGDHVITIPEDTRKHKRTWCSLVPIGESCEYVSTTGLKWNLDKQSLKFGELVSTSNTFDGSNTVTVTCSHTLLFSMRVPSLQNR